MGTLSPYSESFSITLRSSTLNLSNPSVLVESRKNVYIRFSKHHGQGILLDLGWPVEAHGIDSLQELWFPEMGNFYIMTYLCPFVLICVQKGDKNP